MFGKTADMNTSVVICLLSKNIVPLYQDIK